MGQVCCASRGDNFIGGKDGPRIFALSKQSQKTVRKHIENSKDIERKVKEIIAKGEPWQDPEFMPIKDNIYDPAIDTKNI